MFLSRRGTVDAGREGFRFLLLKLDGGFFLDLLVGDSFFSVIHLCCHKFHRHMRWATELRWGRGPVCPFGALSTCPLSSGVRAMDPWGLGAGASPSMTDATSFYILRLSFCCEEP